MGAERFEKHHKKGELKKQKRVLINSFGDDLPPELKQRGMKLGWYPDHGGPDKRKCCEELPRR